MIITCILARELVHIYITRIDISDGPKDVSLTPRKEFYSKGDRIRCSAEAHPIPRYEWKILEYNETFEGPLFVIRSEMIRPASTSLQCTAISDTTGLQAKSHIVKIGLPG